MILKAIAKRWAGSKLEEETAHTQALVRRLETAQAEANRRVNAKMAEYSRQIKAHQEQRNKELKQYLDFMNGQLEITGTYLNELAEFQSFTFVCIDSWMHLDLCNQEINIVNKKLNAIYSTTSLIDAYINELNKQTQRQVRHVWREFTSAREIGVTTDFIEATKRSIERSSKNSNDEFNNELNRLKSHRSLLLKEAATLKDEKKAVHDNKVSVKERHEANKKTLALKYGSCIEYWNVIAKKFESYYAFEMTQNDYANYWFKNLKEGGTLQEIIKVIGTSTDIIGCANEILTELNEEFQLCKQRIKVAHESSNFETLTRDKAERDRLYRMKKGAWEDKESLIEARTILNTRRDELRGYIDRIKPLHPDSAIESICEILRADREFNARSAFGFNTKNQKCEHWEKKNKRIENAATN
ncbi:conserved hypothetical protein [Candidatus Methylobacter favarea]|uniref:Uncharacterized protein n=1 Tax=Candidatus Methylobacter favarea TaxID=2707345 RepID=A0A8S0Y680_9GAMM|nr:hypothetical protein [Candidatus Methylobacter favarea]CAA9890673.1 conserved hypothetical protein [Candidatus Methylobacter favarea]